MFGEIGLIIFLIALSAVYSSTETALLSLPKAKIMDILKERNDRPKTLKLWMNNPNRVLTAVLVGNNFVNILASSVATELTNGIMSAAGNQPSASIAVALTVGVMTLLILTFGEVVPKTFAKNNPHRILPLLFLTYTVYWVFSPLISLLMMITRPTVAAAGGSLGKSGGPTVSEKEIETMIRIGADEGVFSKEKEILYESILEFSKTQAKEIMIPRTDIKGFPIETPINELLDELNTTKFSRYPVYDGDLDHILGILLAKDLLRALLSHKEENIDLRRMLHQTYFVPETKRIGELLREFQAKQNQIAIVVDEWGGTAGLVTLEDVIEEIVGEIYDEYDKAEQNIKSLPDGGYLISAKTPLEDVAEVLGVDFPDQDDYETIGGFVMAKTGKVPGQGTKIYYQGITFRVRDRTRTRIVNLEARREPDEAQEKDKKRQPKTTEET
jgi:CBS domain containing-hemolysin-like protein